MQLASALSAIQESIQAMVQKWNEKELPKLASRASRYWREIKETGEVSNQPNS